MTARKRNLLFAPTVLLFSSFSEPHVDDPRPDTGIMKICVMRLRNTRLLVRPELSTRSVLVIVSLMAMNSLFSFTIVENALVALAGRCEALTLHALKVM